MPSCPPLTQFQAMSLRTLPSHPAQLQRQGTRPSHLQSRRFSARDLHSSSARTQDFNWNEHSFHDFLNELIKSPAMSDRSLLLFSLEGPLRRFAISMTHSREFPITITVLIVVNCFFMLLFDPLEPADSSWNQMLEKAEVQPL